MMEGTAGRPLMEVTVDGRRLRLLQGDLCEVSACYDLLVCSAFRGNYAPVPRTLIGQLQARKGISVGRLALDPELDLRTLGAWMSRGLAGNFRRIACLELLEIGASAAQASDTMLKSAFITLRFLLEQAAARGVPLRSCAMPALGTGNQGIDARFIAVPLLHQCLTALRTIPSLETLDIYAWDGGTAQTLAEVFGRISAERAGASPEVFFSYSSRQQAEAQLLSRSIQDAGLQVWKAPESIPAGSSYQEEIPSALSQAQLLLVLLTPDAQQSRWVQKEVGSAIGAGKAVLPCQIVDFPLNDHFRFLLDGEQILPLWQHLPEDQGPCVVRSLRRLLR